MPGLLEPEMQNYLAASTSIDADFYLRVATQNPDMPYGIVFKLAPGKDYTHSGSGLSESQMRCGCYGNSYQETKQMANDVISEMEAWPTSTNDVQAVFLAGEADTINDNIHHVALDFTIWHTY